MDPDRFPIVDLSSIASVRGGQTPPQPGGKPDKFGIVLAGRDEHGYAILRVPAVRPAS